MTGMAIASKQVRAWGVHMAVGCDYIYLVAPASGGVRRSFTMTSSDPA
jgi:hypothetical protein